MLTRDSIETIMRKSNRRGDNLERDIQILQSYFGLGSQTAPTYQSIAGGFENGVAFGRPISNITEKFVHVYDR